MEPKCKKKTDVVKCVLPWSNLARLNYALGNRKSEASPCLGTSRVIPPSARQVPNYLQADWLPKCTAVLLLDYASQRFPQHTANFEYYPSILSQETALASRSSVPVGKCSRFEQQELILTGHLGLLYTR